ncbi:EF hand [Teladorsagia circumcincta]|uniref:EF hand n=1 Tax=Teladorsagia circumcincta TaxID=45464 RepID=A0A2G9V559_TELCI|nr:EF hand [Teladorsagia circumcincta]
MLEEHCGRVRRAVYSEWQWLVESGDTMMSRESKAAKKKSSKKRSGSEAAQFDQKTINEFKEAFGIMDQNKDGIIDKNDLKDLYATMGQIASDKQIEDMIKEAPGPINFTGKPPIENGEVDYKAFAHLITTGAQDELASV